MAPDAPAAGSQSLQPPITVVLADDHAMVREALARVLESSGKLAVVGQASDGQEALEVVARTRPMCVVLDYTMPRLDAPQAIKALLEQHPRIKILVLTVHENHHYAVKALECGAHGYLIKSAAMEELVSAIRTVTAGQIYVSSSVSEEVFARLRRRKRDREGLDLLSQREFDLLRILGAGNSLQECARRMNISPSSASTYRARIMEKLGLESTAELIRFAVENGIDG